MLGPAAPSRLHGTLLCLLGVGVALAEPGAA